MSSDPQSPLRVVRRLVVANLDRPLPDLVDHALTCLVEALDGRAAFLGTVDDEMLEIMSAVVESGPAIERGLRLPLESTFANADDDADGEVLNVADAGKRQPFKGLEMRSRFGIVSYLGTNWRGKSGDLAGILAVLGKGPRAFSQDDQDLLLVVAGLLAPRLLAETTPANGRSRTPVSAVRLASQEVKEPLAILRGYADMLRNNEVPANQMPLVAQRLAQQ